MQMENPEMEQEYALKYPKNFRKIEDTGHKHKGDNEICVGMIFLPNRIYRSREVKTIVEQVLIENDFYIYGWRQVPVNPRY